MKLVIIYIALTQIFVLGDKVCSTIKSTKYEIEWPSTNSTTVSQPVCLNQNKEFVFRRCLDGQWDAEPDCDDIQMVVLPQCPHGFTDSGTFCYILTEKSGFPPKCPFDNVVPFSTYKSLIGTEIIDEVWMPVKRELSNGFGLLVWVEYSTFYKTTFSGEYIYDGTIKGKDCLTYYNDTVVAKSCNEEVRGVCAYAKLGVVPGLCGTENKCLQMELSSDSNCVCLGFNESYPLAEFREPYQNNIYNFLTNQTCGIGLKKTPSTYVWSSTNETISYTYWSLNVTFDDVNTHGALTPNGWILTQQPSSVTLFEKPLDKVNPILSLEVHTGSSILTITDYQGLKEQNSELLVYCFTNAHPTTLLYRYDNLTFHKYENNVSVNLEMYTGTPGYYWCESFRYNESEVVRSKVVTTTQETYFGAEFVTIVKLYAKNMNPLSDEVVVLVSTKIFPLFDNVAYLKNTYVYRIMKIVDIDEDGGWIWVNLHLTAASGIDDTEDEFYQVEGFVDEALGTAVEIQVELVDFLSSRFCRGEESANLTWPRTKIDEFATSTEYCFKEDGTRLERQCLGNFIDGASWGGMEECQIPHKSEVGEELLRVIDYSPAVVQVVSNITKKYKEFQPFDIYLTGLVLNQYLNQDICNISDFVETFNNVLKIDKEIIVEAQRKMRGTDAILDFLKNNLIDHVQDGYYCMDNIGIASMSNKNTSGLMTIKNDIGVTIDILNGTYLLDDLIKNNNLECAIWLSPELLTQIRGTTLVFVRYFNNSFFSDGTKNIVNIFSTGALVPDVYAGPVMVLHRIEQPQDLNEFSCVYWGESDKSWISSTTLTINNDFLLCQFNCCNNFGLEISSNDDKDTNVTTILQDLLNTVLPSPQIVVRLHQVSERHDEFAPGDVYLVGQILKKVSNDDNIDLKILTSTICNLHKINKTALRDSQIESKATDTILYYVDTILQNHQYHKDELHIADNFMVLVSDLKTTNFTGVVLLERNQTLEVALLNHTINTTDLVADENFDSALVLSPELLTQLDDKIYITVFFNSVLFNDKNSAHTFGKIFGVILPDSGTYKGPLSIFHKKPSSGIHSCDYWDYDEPAGACGSWKRDNDGLEVVPKLIECQYWHATHFGLILVDDLTYDDAALDWITRINFSLSALGLCVIFTTACFKEWRNNTGNRVLLSFSCASMLQIVMFYISSVGQTFRNYLGCVIVGSMLHYSVISTFCWMLIIAVLQFRRFVIVFVETPEYFFLKLSLFAWGLPLVPVGGLLIVDRYNYVVGKVGLCYPTGYGLYVGIWLPVGVIVVINFIIFVYIVNSLIHKKVEVFNASKDGIYQCRLAVLLFFTLGLTWIFGLLMDLDVGVVFSYLFTLTATLQGFVMFLFFIIFNKSTRRLYVQELKRCFRKEG